MCKWSYAIYYAAAASARFGLRFDAAAQYRSRCALADGKLRAQRIPPNRCCALIVRVGPRRGTVACVGVTRAAAIVAPNHARRALRQQRLALVGARALSAKRQTRDD